MNAATLSVHKARAIASSLRSSRFAGRGWDGRVDHELTRQTHDIYLLAQSAAPRVL